jgi:hypothetical protein
VLQPHREAAGFGSGGWRGMMEVCRARVGR